MPESDPLSGADNAWRRLGTVDNLTTITGVLWFEDPITYEELRDRLQERLLRFDRFKQGVDSSGIGRARWEFTEDFDIETHIYHLSLPDPADTATFKQFVSNLMSRPLDERRPLWEAYLVEGAGDGNAVVFRINHSIGDGFALLYVLFGLVDSPEELEMPMGIVPDPPSAEEFRDGKAETAATDTASADDTSAGESSHERSRSLGPDGPLDAVRLAGKAAKTGWNMLTQEDETETSFRGNIGTVKRAGWTEEIDLATVKEVGGACDATVNDVLLAALAGAFRRVLQERGDPVDGRELRVTVPINLRPMHRRDGSLGNYFGLAFVPLPVGEPDLGERIRIIHERMDEETAGLEAFLMYLTLTFGGHTPDFILDLLIKQFENQATGVVTNVPGPLDTVEFAGHEVSDIMFWVPQATDQGIGISIFSYDGGVRLGIAGDSNLLSDPDELSEAFRAEIDAEAADIE
ncbi:wax ester/triacylglycerol synthase family O-acyltransferase [Natronomonas halophila]|uniref:wax ester/triacylglycerol synthase family O-acyltransferase n=1 Tax=Natronomonas halophila TaxID=2747817 RepID=UPI0015B57F17|nr:wax ester/triacylglycerol synthase family O-acyltransferase [Natronomonas halophila]QLD85362.1 wax ester/triacylglycerol synthase family O-acyltransferase [Natronomonas halophila]